MCVVFRFASTQRHTFTRRRRIFTMNPWHIRSEPHFSVGDVVRISGLQAKPELNGCEAEVGGFDEDKGRYNVRVEMGVETILIALKDANLSPAGVPPPPTSSGEHPTQEEPPPPPTTRNGLPAAEGDPWVTCRDPSGMFYWFNKATQESTWTDPKGEALPSGWQAVKDASSDRIYFVNPSTGESSWTAPVAGRTSRAEPRQPTPLRPPLDAGAAASAPRSPATRQSGSAMPGTSGTSSAVAIGHEAASAMRALKAELQEILEEAQAEELADRGGCEHGGAQALHALQACEKMLAAWEARLVSIAT